jgi:hypothetical protein
MSEAFKVSHVCYFTWIIPPFALVLEFGRGQELKERSRCKSLFIRHESIVWAVLSRQQALVEEAN